MKVDKTPNYTQFTSRCNPIKPFKFKTSVGELNVFEPTTEVVRSQEFADEIVDFFFNNFTKDTADPAWLRFQRLEHQDLFKRFKKDYAEEVHQLILNDDGHTTFLTARDKNNKLCGAIMSHGLDEIPFMQKIVMYIANIATDSQYRHSGLGKILMEKAIDADKKYFTDVFLVGEKMAQGFYEKTGFDTLKENNHSQRKIMKYMKSMRFDYPEYVDLFTKPIQADRPRWYDIAATIINKIDI